MKKVLFIASIDKHIKRFHIPSLKWFKERGWEVHVACNGFGEIPFCDFLHQIDFVRSPFSTGHLKALQQLRDLIERSNFNIVHTHTPMASVLARLACKNHRDQGNLKLLYTAHGFHFYKGSPLFYWTLYYPVEKWLAQYTDCLITINSEDFERSKRSFKALQVKRISGMGVDANRFIPAKPGEKEQMRKDLGISPEAFTIIYVAEFIHRKNHEFIIRAATALKEAIPEVEILFAGRGELMEKMKGMAVKLNVNAFVHFLGFRGDIEKVIQAADIGISASRQEGLGLNLIEEMMIGLPVVATMDRGHKEFVEHGKNGYLFNQNNTKEFILYLKTLATDKQLYSQFSEEAKLTAARFDMDSSREDLGNIYLQYI